jgi:hypothetical protein
MLVMMVPVVVRCISGIIPHTMKKDVLRALDTALQQHTKASRRIDSLFFLGLSSAVSAAGYRPTARWSTIRQDLAARALPRERCGI